MHRIDGPAAAPGGFFTDGDPNLGTPATVVTDDWLNAVQEELAGVIEGGGGAVLSKPSNGQLLTAIAVLVGRAVPAGAVQAFAMSTVPLGWLACNGALVSRAANAALFSAIGTTYGVGDGASTFGLPDLRGEFIRGLDGGRGVDAGRALGSAQGDLLKSHTHAIFPNTGGTESHNRQVITQSSTEGDETTSSDFVQPTGGVETRPRNVALAYCIKA